MPIASTLPVQSTAQQASGLPHVELPPDQAEEAADMVCEVMAVAGEGVAAAVAVWGEEVGPTTLQPWNTT